MSRRKTIEEFVADAIAIHDDKYDYSLVDYKNNRTKIQIICKNHGIFLQTPHKHLYGQGCNKCGLIRAGKMRLLSTDQFIKKAKLIHGDTYDYTLTKYKLSRLSVIITCKRHGTFKQSPNDHLSGKGCNKCGNLKTTEQFIQESKSTHGNTYDYSITEYVSVKSKLKIICKLHGIFKQRPDIHLKCSGCNKCKIEDITKTPEQFIQEAKTKHGDTYDYSLVNYINNATKVNIICKIHGSFFQQPNSHTRGANCPKCIFRISKPERQWLESINLPDDKYHRQVPLQMIKGKKRNVDGYNPKTNTVYEFNGDFWHGNPDVFPPNEMNVMTKKTFGELYENTIKKETLIRESGYNLIVMWENDWNKIAHPSLPL